MYAMDALTKACAVLSLVLALLLSLFAWPEIPTFFLLLGLYFSFYVVAQTVGNDLGWCATALKFFTAAVLILT